MGADEWTGLPGTWSASPCPEGTQTRLGCRHDGVVEAFETVGRDLPHVPVKNDVDDLISEGDDPTLSKVVPHAFLRDEQPSHPRQER